MSSLTRKLRRAFRRRGGLDWPTSETPHRTDKAGYSALHPTKGWRRISYKRLAAQHRMAQIFGA